MKSACRHRTVARQRGDISIKELWRRGRRAVERETACAIIGAAPCGCLDHDKLVAIGPAAGSTAMAFRNGAFATNINEPSAAT